ncbi:MAG: hypothetical protein WC914_04495 [Proteiniphilum sp.]
MADLTKHTQPIADAIYKHWEETASDWRRDHLGASVLGNPCDRAIWYGFRWAKPPDFPGRVLRLFDTGQREEARLVNDLRNIGLEVHDRDPEAGGQIRVSYGHHIGGSLDGVSRNVPQGGDKWHVLEFKTHNDKSFLDLQKKGVAESKPAHFIQMQIYMHLIGIERALYVAKNKNTDSIYTERIHLDTALAKAQLMRADRIVKSTSQPGGISENPADYRCKFCPFWKLCYEGEQMSKSCRTCKAVRVTDDGWACSKGIKADPREGCGEWGEI